MSKNLIVLFIIILLIVGGFGIYTYDQSNQAKKDVEEKNFELESKDELISELKENTQDKEKQIEELKASLAKGEEDLEKEYVDKLSELTEEKTKLETLLAEEESSWLDKDKEKQQLIIKLEEEVKGYKENINKLENEIVDLKEEAIKLAKGEEDLEKEYVDKLSELTEEKTKLETLLAKKEEAIKTIEKQKEESEQIVILKDELVLELKENTQDKEKQIEELKASLAKGEEDLEKEYVDKLSELTEEKTKLETLLAEEESSWLDKDKEKQQLIIKLEEEVKGYKENINKLENEIVDLKEEAIKLAKEEKDLEKEYTLKVSELMEEKGQLEALLIEQEGISQAKDREKGELISKLENCNNQINEVKEKLAQQEIEDEKNYIAELSALTEEKDKLETQLKASQVLLSEKENTIVLTKQQNEESEKSVLEKDKAIAELSESIKGYENQIKEISEQVVKEEEKEIEKEAEYSNKLSLLTEEKDKLETQLKVSQDLLLERENTIVLLKQQKEDSERVISGKDKTIAELSESIKGYDNLVKEIQEQMAQEGKEKEAEYTDRLALLKEGRDIIESKLAEAIKKSIPDYYEVKKGDSLWKIAERFYNAGGKWIRIFEANMNKIKNPSMIYPYQRLTIPKE